MLNERSLLSQFLHFVAATVASLMVFSLYSIVDGLMVIKGVGEYAMAAVNLAVPFTNVLFSIGVIFAVGTSTIIAIYLGQNQGEKANSLFSQNIVLLTCVGLTITVLVFVFLEPFAVLLGAKGVTYQYTIDYLRGLAPFALCFIISYNMEVLIKTDGYPRLAILTVITGCLANCVLDYIAIFLLDLGRMGRGVGHGSFPASDVHHLSAPLPGRTQHLPLCEVQDGLGHLQAADPAGLCRRRNGAVQRCDDLPVQPGHPPVPRRRRTGELHHHRLREHAERQHHAGHLAGQSAAGELSLRQGGRGGLQEAAAVWLYSGGHHDGGDLRRGDDLCPQIAGIFLGAEKPWLLGSAAGALRRYGLCYILLGSNILMGGFLTAVERPKAAISISVGRGLLFQAGALLLLAAAVGGTGIWFAPVISEALCAVMAVWFLRQFPAENRGITNIKKYPAAQPRRYLTL